MQIFSDLSVVHTLKGRVRFKYRPSLEFKSHSVISYMNSKKSIKNTKINKTAKSITIYFDDSKVSIDEIKSMLFALKQGDTPSKNIEPTSLKELSRATMAFGLLPFLSRDFKFIITLLASLPSLKKGMEALGKKGLNAEVLDALAISISLYRGDYFTANTTNFMLELGEYIEGRIEQKSTSMLKSLLVPKIDKVWLVKDGCEIEIEYNELKQGDVISISVGDSIGVDGIIVEGEALLNEVSMSGESTPVHKKAGDRVTSGTLVSEGKIKVIAERIGEETAIATIANYVENSLEEKSQKESEARKLADSLVPVTLGVSSLSYMLSRDINRVASVFQADYSCALKLATPVAFRSSMYKAGLKGALIKSGNALERLSECDMVIFDKTGTLTSGDLEISEVISLDGSWRSDRILSLAASIEEHYFHPVAKAVVEAARSCEKCTHFHHSEVEFIVAHGVEAEVNNKKVVIGSRHFLEDDEKIDFSRAKKEIDKLTKEGKSLLYIGYDGKLLGIIALNDQIRESSYTLVKNLKDSGIKKCIMLTGDHEQKAKEVADELGLDEFYAQLLPEEKAKIVKQYSDEGYKIAFIGDGINDAPSIASSFVGIAMAKGADIARITADISLLEDDIEIVVGLKKLADETIKLIKLNYNLTLGVNSTILLLASLGAFGASITSIAHNSATIGILLNALKGAKQDV
ncbi:MAG: heavy metal translocating P-type ATPase [Campylobacterales bacterium]